MAGHWARRVGRAASAGVGAGARRVGGSSRAGRAWGVRKGAAGSWARGAAGARACGAGGRASVLGQRAWARRARRRGSRRERTGRAAW